MPYSGMSIGYGWGANDAGGSNHYANRGLYNYQPRYTTPTTASNNRLIGNYVHDVMQQMTDGGCIYTLSANPGAHDQRELLPADQRLVRALLRRGLALLHRHATTSSPPPAPGPPPTTGARENMGNFTVTNNWSTNGSTNVTNGDRGNVVTGNVTVTNGNWPSGAQAVIAAGRRRRAAAARPTGRADRGRPVGPLRRRRRLQHRPTAPRRSCGTAHGGANQRWTYTASRQLQVYGNKCLDATGQGTTNGTQVVIWDCNGQANQQWNVNANGTITGVQSGLCLDANGAGHRQRHEDHPLVLQRRHQPAVEPALARGAGRVGGAPTRHPRAGQRSRRTRHECIS